MAAEPSKPKFVVTSVRSLDDPRWTSRSVPAEDLTPQFSFLLSRTVYVGGPNSSEQIQSGRYDRLVSTPSLGARDPLRPTAGEVRGHEGELATYYRHVMALKGERPRAGDVDYWLRLDFVSPTTGKAITFPWWDRVSDAARFRTWVRKTDATKEFFDADQGWMLRAAHKGQRFHVQHNDLDTGEEFANLSVGAAEFLNRFEVAEADVGHVIAALKKELGVDPWS
jgi:hypothetical protein